jgi:hypothetical protein
MLIFQIISRAPRTSPNKGKHAREIRVCKGRDIGRAKEEQERRSSEIERQEKSSGEIERQERSSSEIEGQDMSKRRER